MRYQQMQRLFPKVPISAKNERRLVVHKVIRDAVREMADYQGVKMSALMWEMVCWFWDQRHDSSDAGRDHLIEILQEAYDE